MNEIEARFVEQISKDTEEVWSLKYLLDEKEVYASELVQKYTPSKRRSTFLFRKDKVFLIFF